MIKNQDGSFREVKTTPCNYTGKQIIGIKAYKKL